MTEIMGILNLTPDSFSGDGKHQASVSEQLNAVNSMIADGAAVIDIGAESTRPGATALSPEEEWARIAPLLKALGPAGMQRASFSLDTYHPENAARAIHSGFSWINDVSGGTPAMLKAVSGSNVRVVLMHSLSVPADPKNILPEEADPVAEVLAWGKGIITAAAEAGIARERLVLDPGIGFGKTAAQSLELIRHAVDFRAWGVPVVFGHSRKSFLEEFAGNDRDTATLGVSAFLAQQGVDYLRVHQVREHRDMLAVMRALA